MLKFIRVILFISALIVSIGSNAQSGKSSYTEDPVKMGSVVLNAGVGIGSDYKGDYYNPATGIKIAVEWGLWQAGPGVITFGGETGISFSSGGYYSDYIDRTSVIAVRSAWNFGFFPI
jgi:hypothetical protein